MIADVIGRAAVPGEPRRVGAALVLATVVTLAAVVPLGIVAWQARADGPVKAEGLTLMIAGDTSGLAGHVLHAGTDAELGIDDPDLVAAAWALYSVEGSLVAEGSAVGTPPYALDLAPGTIAGLEPGVYDLLVSATESDGEVVERGARFAIGDRG